MTSPLRQNQPITNHGITKGVAVVKLNIADLTDADTSQTITWAALMASHPVGSSAVPANAVITNCSVRRVADFAGGTLSALVINIGDAGDIDELLASVDLFTGAKAVAAFTESGIVGTPYTWSSPETTFADLGSGASDTLAIAGFPVNSTLLGWNVVITTPYAGEADLAFTLGHTADPDGLIVSFNLNAVAAGTAATVAGALYPRPWADLSTSGLGWTFTATELDDVTAGAMRVDFYVLKPRPRLEAAYSPIVTVTSTGDDLDNITAGECEISISYEAFDSAPVVL